MKKLAILSGLLITWLLVGGSASAHHGGAAYDREQMVTIKAKITEFSFINPHVLVLLDETDDKGNLIHWTAESPDDPAMLERQGWTRHTLNAGDVVTVVGHPSKNGAKVMSLVKVIMPDGKEFTNHIAD
jgi:hypothetical protein